MKNLYKEFELLKTRQDNIQGRLEGFMNPEIRDTLRVMNMLNGEIAGVLRFLKRNHDTTRRIRNPIGFAKYLAKKSKYTPSQKQAIKKTEACYRIYLDARDEINNIASEIGRLLGPQDPEIEVIDAPRETKVQGILNPFKPIPNVEKFTLGLEKGVDLLFLNHGLLKKVRMKPTFEPYRNKSMNRFVEYQIMKLHEVRDRKEYALYWRRVYALMLRSTSFLVCAFNNKYPNWQRKMR